MTNTGLPPKSILKLFDQLVKPIALYGSEIWGMESVGGKDLTRDHVDPVESLSKTVCEKLNVSSPQKNHRLTQLKGS